MSYIDWSDQFRLGIPSVDDDHQRLFEHLDIFLTAEHDGLPSTELAVRLDSFLIEAAAHFAREERMLDRHDYPFLATHRLEHERLLAHLGHFRERIVAGVMVADHANEAADYLRAWLLRHILEEDQRFRPFLMRLT